MITCYEVLGSGDLVEVRFGTANMSSSGIYCVVVPTTKTIYFWKGRDASVRKKFTGAKTATDLQAKIGPDFKVHPIDEGAEPYEFKELLRSN